jgi:drug/metabolite transporter (DMT)-like permease
MSSVVGSATAPRLTSSVVSMPRVSSVHLMVLGTVLLWALNVTVTRYVLTHGFEPLAYATVRYGIAALIFLAMALATERSLRVLRSDIPLVAAAAIVLWINQLAFVYALDTATASVVALLLGATPIFAGLLVLALRLDRVGSRFWLGAAVSFLGVALVGIGGRGELHGGTAGILLGVATAATWAGYSVAIAPLMRRYSPTRISALVLGAGWIAISLTGARQTAAQDLSLDWDVWALLAFATLGPLVLTNVLWFRALHRIGAARATLAANLNPFIAAIIALLLLSEPVTMLQVVGGVLIAAGIVVARRPARREPARDGAWTPAAARRRLRPWAAGERARGS